MLTIYLFESSGGIPHCFPQFGPGPMQQVCETIFSVVTMWTGKESKYDKKNITLWIFGPKKINCKFLLMSHSNIKHVLANRPMDPKLALKFLQEFLHFY